jgi:hypothetical protein
MMDKLTIDEIIDHCERKTEQYERLFGKECLETTPLISSVIKEYWEHKQVAEYLKKLKEYQQLEEQSRLVKLPCKVGDDVWFVPSQANYKLNILNHHSKANRVYHQKVAKITFSMNGWYLECDKDLEYATDHILVDKMYKETWFLTKNEAEAKLKELGGGGND